MKINILPLLFGFIVTTCLVPAQASALGFGLYGSFGMGATKYSYEGSNIIGEKYQKDWNTNHMRYGFGMALDTIVAKNKLLNYRMNLGFALGAIDVRRKRKDLSDGSVSRGSFHYDIYDISIYNTLGFGIVRFSFMRFWIGPQLGINYSFDRLTIPFSEFSFKLGLAAGFNFHIGELISLIIDGGARFQISTGTNPFTHYGYEGFLNAGVLFRFNDNF